MLVSSRIAIPLEIPARAGMTGYRANAQCCLSPQLSPGWTTEESIEATLNRRILALSEGL